VKGEGISVLSALDTIWSADEPAGLDWGILGDRLDEVEGVSEDPRIACGGYRAKKRVNRGGSDSASLTNCLGFSDMMGAPLLKAFS
jgi:hypothetical protein